MGRRSKTEVIYVIEERACTTLVAARRDMS